MDFIVYIVKLSKTIKLLQQLVIKVSWAYWMNNHSRVLKKKKVFLDFQ